jgi:single-strand DNA-binding protein
MNKIFLTGHLTRDVDFTCTPTGMNIAKIGLAVNTQIKKKDDTYQDETLFIDAVLFGKTAERANQTLSKGSKVLIEGRIRLETWTDQSGQKRSKHSVLAESFQLLGYPNNEPKKLNQINNKISEVDLDELPF